MICLNSDRFIQGRFSEIKSRTFQVVIDVNTLEASDSLSIGQDCPLLDGYHGGLAELVLSSSLVWSRVKFEPTDSIMNSPDGRVEITNGGWEHEHCEICMRKISPYEEDNNPYGYVNQRNNWLCESCFEQYVEKKSIDFINLDQIF